MHDQKQASQETSSFVVRTAVGFKVYITRKNEVVSTYGHSQLKTGHPVRSAIHKQLNGRLVLRWVTTWESLLQYVLFIFFLTVFSSLLQDESRCSLLDCPCT
ncbi:hypothetical protein KCU65_g5901, partial [Aureobasidium melanogenum]